MKRVLIGVIMVGLMGLVGGCASPCGMTYIGPVSYYHAKACDSALMMRSAAVSASIPAEKKAPIFKAVALGSSPNEIAAGVGVDIFALTDSQYTGGEVFMQFLSSVVDAVIYGGVGYGAYKAVDGGGSTKAVNTYTINGDNNNINGGSGSQQNNSASNGGANGDMAIGK